MNKISEFLSAFSLSEKNHGPNYKFAKTAKCFLIVQQFFPPALEKC